MPVQTIKCSICDARISGYDMPERMGKLRRHYKRMHPAKFRQMIKKSIATKREKGIIKNPYPLLIATLANPGQYKNIPEAVKCFRESHGDNAEVRFETANIQGLAEGSVWIYQGTVKYLIYNSGKVERTTKGADDWEHTVGDGVKEVVNADLYYNVEKTAMLIIVRDKNGKILKTIKEGFLNERQG